ncbi:hypothetical protein SERLADRAFT_452251, partial [Serpula lacrymans var. lacrymans S7.9]
IGVVTSVRSAVRTRSNEWSVSFTIADFSNLGADQGLGYLQNEGLAVNCFQDKYLEWLPSPSVGDVIILRRLKVKLFFTLLHHRVHVPSSYIDFNFTNLDPPPLGFQLSRYHDDCYWL